MSGRTKRIFYQTLDILLYLAAGVVMILVTIFTVPKERPEIPEMIAVVALLASVFLNLLVLVHELGHLLFGTLVGMRLVSFRIHLLSRGTTAGQCAMIPKNGRGVRGKLIVFSLGGGILNLLLGAVLYALYFALPYHPALLYCEMLAPFLLFEGIRALLPAELPAGKTDGAVILGLLRKSPEEEVMLRVLTAQGILYRGSFSEIPQSLLWQTPVVREDLPAWHALLFLRACDLFSKGRSKDARRTLARLSALDEYLSDSQRGEVERYLGYFNGTFEIKKQLLSGVNELEKKLFSEQNYIS